MEQREQTVMDKGVRERQISLPANRNEIITAPSEPISGLESNSEYVFISSLSNLYNYTIIICHASCVPGHFLTIQEIRRLRPDYPMVMLRPSGGQVCHPADSDRIRQEMPR